MHLSASKIKTKNMFKEKRLINSHGGGGGGSSGNILKKVTSAFDPRKTKAEAYATTLHNNATSSPWNEKKIERAQEVSMNIGNIATDVRNSIKKALWDSPRHFVGNLLNVLNRSIFDLPAWAFTKIKHLAIDTPAKLLTSMGVIGVAEVSEATDYPAKIAHRTRQKVGNVLGKIFDVDAGSGAAAPAHAH